jgi:hypothetical protein
LHLGFKVFLAFVGNASIHILLRAIADIRPPWFDIGSEEEDTFLAIVEHYFSLMKLQSQLYMKEVTNLHSHIFQNFSIWMKKYHIIHIASVVFDLEFVLYKMVELMQIKISEKLTHEISEWEPILF